MERLKVFFDSLAAVPHLNHAARIAGLATYPCSAQVYHDTGSVGGGSVTYALLENGDANLVRGPSVCGKFLNGATCAERAL
jgi:hypothetical protein